MAAFILQANVSDGTWNARQEAHRKPVSFELPLLGLFGEAGSLLLFYLGTSPFPQSLTPQQRAIAAPKMSGFSRFQVFEVKIAAGGARMFRVDVEVGVKAHGGVSLNSS